jgi:hypothetical protein
MLPQTMNSDGRMVYLNRMAHPVLASLEPAGATRPTDRIFHSCTPDQVRVAFCRVAAKSR